MQLFDNSFEDYKKDITFFMKNNPMDNTQYTHVLLWEIIRLLWEIKEELALNKIKNKQG